MNQPSFLNCNEHIIITGTYDVSVTSSIPNLITLLMNIDKNPLGINVLTANFYIVSEPLNLLLETYSINSYDLEDNSIGEIQFTSFYKNDTGTSITQAGIYSFNVNSSNGIYKNVCRVVIDTNDIIRKVFFIRKEN